MGKVQILGGKHARRWIQFSDTSSIRPSGSRVRKTLFDWLRFNIQNKCCLDLFSGSGILAFEAMSQGAQSVHCIDHDSTNCQMIESEAKRINEPDISVQCARIPKLTLSGFDVVFMDAPFDQPILLEETLKWVSGISLVNPGGILYIESAQEITFVEGFTQYRVKRIGNVWLHLFKRNKDE